MGQFDWLALVLTVLVVLDVCNIQFSDWTVSSLQLNDEKSLRRKKDKIGLFFSSSFVFS